MNKKQKPKEGDTETLSVSEVWRLIAKTAGASDEQAEDLVKRTEDTGENNDR
ncbi:MAG: hypothetical protein LBJ96_00390 [Holosporaceae bacterium]|jgi:hypothetical protein|nr:hypothetical protein [Holosporaceae bacterium]